MNTFTLSKKRDVLHKQRGMTLVELMIVLGIIAIVMAGTLRPASSVLANASANDEVRELWGVISNAQRLYANRANFADATQAAFVNSGTFPENRVIDGTTNLINRWGGTIEVEPVTIGAGAPNNGLALTYQGVPKKECAAIIPQLDKVIRVAKVNDTVVKQDGKKADLAAVGEACQESEMNEVIYEFSK